LLSKFHISSRLLWAILISLFLHLVLAGGWHVLLPNLDFSTHVIKAELAPSPPRKTTLPPKRHVAKKAMKRSAPKPTSSPPVSSGPSLATEPAYVPVPMIGEEDRPPYEEPKALPPPKYVETEFEVKKTGFGSGKARYRFDLVGEGRYHLQSEVQAVGLASLAFSGKRLETSVGSVTEYGLRPDSYRYEISSKPEKFQGADFDWVNHQVTLSTAKSKETVDLPDDAQDFLSFMYQFMFVPPLDRMQHSLTNGKTLHTIDYLFVSEDQIASKLGNLNTVHIAKSSGDSDERTELWLAVDYRFIPVKILKIAKDGSGYELLVTRIDTDIGKE
jgi:hypothetical protein